MFEFFSGETKLSKIALAPLDSNVKFWRENSNIFTLKLNLARFARNVVNSDKLGR